MRRGLLERLEGYKVPVVTGATARDWRPDADRKSQLIVERDGKLERRSSRFIRRSRRRAGISRRRGRRRVESPRRLPNLADAPKGFAVKVGDSLYPEPLRDAVSFANRLGRVL